jgi:hypothetical protein
MLQISDCSTEVRAPNGSWERQRYIRAMKSKIYKKLHHSESVEHP